MRFDFPFKYNIEPFIKHETLCPAHTVELITVPDYAVNYVLNYFLKRDILAVLKKHYYVLTGYGIWPRYVIKGMKEEKLK